MKTVCDRVQSAQESKDDKTQVVNADGIRRNKDLIFRIID